MSKNTKQFILIMGICIVIIIASWIGINALDGDSHYDSSLCTICHQNKRIANATYCYSCYLKAQERVEEKEKQKEGAAENPKTTLSGSSGKTTSSSSSTKVEYNSLNYDPEDYDDPDEYADDAWDEDFDSYDEAYEYWEDY